MNDLQKLDDNKLLDLLLAAADNAKDKLVEKILDTERLKEHADVFISHIHEWSIKVLEKFIERKYIEVTMGIIKDLIEKVSPDVLALLLKSCNDITQEFIEDLKEFDIKDAIEDFQQDMLKRLDTESLLKEITDSKAFHLLDELEKRF